MLSSSGEEEEDVEPEQNQQLVDSVSSDDDPENMVNILGSISDDEDFCIGTEEAKILDANNTEDTPIEMEKDGISTAYNPAFENPLEIKINAKGVYSSSQDLSK